MSGRISKSNRISLATRTQVHFCAPLRKLVGYLNIVDWGFNDDVSEPKIVNPSFRLHWSLLESKFIYRKLHKYATETGSRNIADKGKSTFQVVTLRLFNSNFPCLNFLWSGIPLPIHHISAGKTLPHRLHQELAFSKSLALNRVLSFSC